MIVLKFGGTSLKNAEKIEQVKQIISQSLPRHPVVVVSAHSGVTDQLIELAHNALENRLSIQPIQQKHHQLLHNLHLPTTLIEDLLTELQDLLRGIQLVKELTPRTLDYVMSFGERMSSRIVAAYLSNNGIDAIPICSYEMGLLTDSNFGRAQPLPQAFENIASFLKKVSKLPVITGFLGKNLQNEITTLGRSGSDFSASIIGSAINAEEIQIWTDVNGIMSADPRVVPHAVSIEEMSFEEASELAYYGAKVIHPSTMLPAMEKNIPVRILNTYNPTHPGTLVKKHSAPSKNIAKAIASKRNILLINLVSTHMLQQYGFMAKVFEVFARHKIVLDMIATSEISVSITIDSPKNLDKAISELQQYADVHVSEGKAILCIVGEGIREHSGVAAKTFSTLANENIHVEMISQGATKINLSLLVDNDHVSKAVQALHKEFFE